MRHCAQWVQCAILVCRSQRWSLHALAVFQWSCLMILCDGWHIWKQHLTKLEKLHFHEWWLSELELCPPMAQRACHSQTTVKSQWRMGQDLATNAWVWSCQLKLDLLHIWGASGMSQPPMHRFEHSKLKSHQTAKSDWCVVNCWNCFQGHCFRNKLKLISFCWSSQRFQLDII